MAVVEDGANPRRVDICAVGSKARCLIGTVKELNADGWTIRQVFHEQPTYYRVFAQRKMIGHYGGNTDGKGDAAIAIIEANPKLSNLKLSVLLKDNGIKRSQEWVRQHKLDQLQENAVSPKSAH